MPVLPVALVLAVALLLTGAGFASHPLWWVALLLFAALLLGVGSGLRRLRTHGRRPTGRRW